MKLRYVASLLLIAWARPAPAQDHLSPDVSVFVDPDEYVIKVRHVFAMAFQNGVKLRVLVLPSFEDEYVVGLRGDGDRIEAFVLRPSANIFLSGPVKPQVGVGLNPDLLPGAASLRARQVDQARKDRSRIDSKSIRPILKARPIPRKTADELANVWQAALLDAKYPKEADVDTDGIEYQFSGPFGPRDSFGGRGEVSAHINSPDADSKMGRFVALTEGLADYAEGKSDPDQLERLLVKVDRP